MSASADNIKQAWSAIIGENVLRQNITAIRDAAAKMPLAVRYQYLSRQVLPNGSRSNLRLAIDFAPTSSSATRDVDASAPLLNCGEPLVSPALDLIETATELNKLADLRNTVERITAASPAERIQQAAFLALLAISERDFATANKQLQQVFELTQSTPLTAAEPGAETLAVFATARHTETRESARELVHLLYQQAQRNSRPRSERWHRHIYSLKHAFEDLKEPNQVQQQKPVQAADERVRHWFPISRMDAQSRGLGYPSSYWKFDHEGVRHITSHDHDYLQHGKQALICFRT